MKKNNIFIGNINIVEDGKVKLYQATSPLLSIIKLNCVTSCFFNIDSHSPYVSSDNNLSTLISSFVGLKS